MVRKLSGRCKDGLGAAGFTCSAEDKGSVFRTTNDRGYDPLLDDELRDECGSVQPA